MKALKQIHWFEIALIIVVMSVHLYAAFSAPHNFSMRWFTRDDAFYYFKVAQNISEGHGSTFDGVNLTNGYHPLWLLICVPVFALARFDLILPLRLLLLIMAGLSAATSVLLFRFLRKHTGEAIAMLAASYWAFSMDLHGTITQQGMETGIVALSLVLFLYMLQRSESKEKLTPRDLAGLGLAALFVVFSRLDGIFFVIVAGIWIVFRRHSLRYLLPFDLLMTFSIIVLAFIQRAGLKFYLLDFDSSAVMMAAITFVFQSLIFYFAGLYTHPKNIDVIHIFLITFFSVTLSALVSTGIMLALVAAEKIDMPRAVPALYWAGMLVSTLLSRLAVRRISPWPITLSSENKPNFGFLAGAYQVRVAMEQIRKWLMKAVIYFGIAGGGLAAYMLTNLALFGTFMPVSGQIKRWWGSIPNDVYGGGAKTWLDVFELDPGYSDAWGMFTYRFHDWSKLLAQKWLSSDFWYWAIFLAAAGLWMALFLRNRRKNLRRVFLTGLVPLLISAELHAFSYGALAYAAKQEWYWIIQILTLVIVLALGLRMFFDLFQKSKAAEIVLRAGVALASLYLVYGFANVIINRMPYTDAYAGQPYMDTLPILENYTEPGAMIGMTGGGNTGYFIHGRTIVNMDGLINSYPYFMALKNNQAGKYLAGRGLGYVFANKYIMTNTMPYRYQFTPEELTPVEGAPAYGQKELMRYTPAK